MPLREAGCSEEGDLTGRGIRNAKAADFFTKGYQNGTLRSTKKELFLNLYR